MATKPPTSHGQPLNFPQKKRKKIPAFAPLKCRCIVCEGGTVLVIHVVEPSFEKSGIIEKPTPCAIVRSYVNLKKLYGKLWKVTDI